MTTKNPLILTVVLLVLLLQGYAHQHGSRDRYTFADSQVARWHKSALEAAASPEEWVRVGGVRLTKGPLNLDPSNLEYNLDCPDPYQVEVIIGCIGRLGDPRDTQNTFVRARLNRATATVYWMKEERY